MPRVPCSPAVAALAGIVLAACGGDAVAPETTASLHLATADSVLVHTAPSSTGARGVACPMEITAVLDGGGSATIDSMTISFIRPADGVSSGIVTVPSQVLQSVWNGSAVTGGMSNTLRLDVLSSTLFTLRADMVYHGGTSAVRHTATRTQRCVPPLRGRWILSSINDVRMPATYFSWRVNSDTLFFADDELKYRTRASITAGFDELVRETALQTYDAPAVDSIILPEVMAGTAGGSSKLSGTTLTTRHTEFGQLPEAWRFDREGSVVVLPTPPSLVVSKTEVRFTAKQGGPMPAPDTVRVTSSTGATFVGLEVGGSSTSVNGYGASDWLRFASPLPTYTPSILVYSVRTTSLPPGTYTELEELKSPSVGSNTARIRVVYVIEP